MRKSFLLLLNIILLTLSCKKKNPDILYNKLTHKDITHNLYLKKKKEQDSIKQAILKKNNQNSPIKIISSKLYKNEYSNHKDIKIVYKNLEKKDVQAIKFEWYCKNSFDEPAHTNFFYVQGKSKANSVGLLRSGKTTFKIWENFSTDANEIIYVRAYYVVFSDGTKWEYK